MRYRYRQFLIAVVGLAWCWPWLSFCRGWFGGFTAEIDWTVSATTWLDAAIQVNGATWPVLQMEWIDGQTLDQHIDSVAVGSIRLITPGWVWRRSGWMSCAGCRA